MPAFCPKNYCGWLRPADFWEFYGLSDETTAQLFRRCYRVHRGLDGADGRMGDASILLFPLVLCLENEADCFGRWICGDFMVFRMNAPLKLFAGGNRFMKMYTTINQKQSLIGFLCCSWKGCVGIDYRQGRGWNIITYWKYNTTISTDESFHASYNELENKKLNYSIGYGLSNSYVAGIREKMIWLRCLRAVVDGVNKIMSEIYKNRVKITYLFKLIWTQESRCCQIIWI